MKTRCRPGDRCVVVAEVAGCECNVGVTLTVTILGLAQTPAGTQPIWAFKDADRPVKVVHLDDFGRVVPGTPVVWSTGAEDFPDDHRPGVFDHHLVPLPPTPEQMQQEVREAEPV